MIMCGNCTLLMMGIPGVQELLIIAGIFVLLFGARKIPERMKGLGQGIRGLKDGLSEANDAVEEIK